MPLIYVGTTSSQDYLAHHGILGQKWGVRRYQNLDGTLTPEGRERYRKPTEQKKFAEKLKKSINSNYKYYRTESSAESNPQVLHAAKRIIDSFHGKDKTYTDEYALWEQDENAPNFEIWARKRYKTYDEDSKKLNGLIEQYAKEYLGKFADEKAKTIFGYEEPVWYEFDDRVRSFIYTTLHGL